MTRLYGQIVTLLWFTRESYDGALRLFAPGHSLPTHFEEWLSGAEQREQQLHRAGHATARIDMDCDVFLEYCRVKNAPVDYASCNKWARDVVADSTKANLPDYRHPSFRHGALRRR